MPFSGKKSRAVAARTDSPEAAIWAYSETVVTRRTIIRQR
jgi:hypothetical protein